MQSDGTEENTASVLLRVALFEMLKSYIYIYRTIRCWADNNIKTLYANKLCNSICQKKRYG